MIKNRSEFLFLYDVFYSNPNGDANDNIPRNDGEFILVSPQRLKRTIRDYLLDYKGKEIFVRKEILDETKRTLKTREVLYSEYGSPNVLMQRCIDIRLFGGTFALKSKSGSTSESTNFSLTGPVQFAFGKSLNRVNPEEIQGTCVIPSTSDQDDDEKRQGTFTSRYVVPYALIAFWGIANENIVAKEQKPLGHTLTDDDIALMIEAMWKGTRNLTSDSKVGQLPRFLLQIIYKEGSDFHIGRLNSLISIQPISDKSEEDIKDITDYVVDFSKLDNLINAHKEKILKIRYVEDILGQLNIVNANFLANAEKIKF
ncbi:MAG: type I-B CRISPR-associated protein Cas7/Csh2 [Candidatus Aenigmarchaeota archaeon]|nr:type I-B CRISPR-associated protein Cas7/Csh2 [Candidatus Aenigmarchaeota archaeon]MDW8149136.1 type I-B CRISPR-associated protein Cas7/Csh2 [Candidatus Aenigmarchaeota archaeon]